MSTYIIPDRSQVWLAHHGIAGQKWGHRNGPPYPLDEKDHSAAEKKAGWKKSLNRVEKDPKKSYNRNADEWKKAGKIAAISAIEIGRAHV